jgi:hypothetical protein
MAMPGESCWHIHLAMLVVRCSSPPYRVQIKLQKRVPGTCGFTLLLSKSGIGGCKLATLECPATPQRRAPAKETKYHLWDAALGPLFDVLCEPGSVLGMGTDALIPSAFLRNFVAHTDSSIGPGHHRRYLSSPSSLVQPGLWLL